LKLPRLILSLLLLALPLYSGMTETDDTARLAAAEASLIRQLERMAYLPPTEQATWWREKIGDTSSPTLWHAAGRLHAAAREWPEAEAAFTRSLANDPGRLETEIELAATYTAQQTPRLAIKLLSARMEEAAMPSRAFLVYGQALLDAGDPFTADTAFRQALLRDPADLAARRGLARALAGQTRWAELLRWCELRLAESPNDRLAISWKLDALLGLERWAEADDAVAATKAAGAFTENHQWTLAGRALTERRIDDVLRLWDRRFPALPKDAPHMIQAAFQLVEAGKPRSAAGIANRLENLPPSPDAPLRADIHWLSATIALATGDPERARQESARGLELDPDHAGLNALREKLPTAP